MKKVKGLLLVGVIGVVALALLNARDFQRYLHLRNM